MNLDSYFNYLKEFATDHKQILHDPATPRFFRVDIEELDNALRSKANYPLVAALNPTISTGASISTNTRKNYQGALLLLNTIKDKGNAVERSTKEDVLWTIAEDFITKFINDRRSYDIANKKYVLSGLDLNGFTLELVPESYTSMCGVLVGFRFNEALSAFDASRWNNQSRYQV